jgi:hypothetical protein
MCSCSDPLFLLGIGLLISRYALVLFTKADRYLLEEATNPCGQSKRLLKLARTNGTLTGIYQRRLIVLRQITNNSCAKTILDTNEWHRRIDNGFVLFFPCIVIPNMISTP